MHLYNRTRKELFEYALRVIQDEFSNEMVKNLSKLEDPDRYYNWYYGYTFIGYPLFMAGNFDNQIVDQLYYGFSICATSGNISNKYFGEKFDSNKIDSKIFMRIVVQKSPRAFESNITLLINIDRIILGEVNDNDKMTLDQGFTNAQETKAHISSKGVPKVDNIMYWDRKASKEYIVSMKLDKIPGFRLTWKYGQQVEPQAACHEDDSTIQFVRTLDFRLLKCPNLNGITSRFCQSGTIT